MPKKRQSSVVTIRQLEEQILAREGIRVVFRLPGFLGPAVHNGRGYDFKRGLGGDKPLLALWARMRKVFGGEVSFVVVRGDGKVIENTAGRAKLGVSISTVRKSYT